MPVILIGLFLGVFSIGVAHKDKTPYQPTKAQVARQEMEMALDSYREGLNIAPSVRSASAKHGAYIPTSYRATSGKVVYFGE